MSMTTEVTVTEVQHTASHIRVLLNVEKTTFQTVMVDVNTVT